MKTNEKKTNVNSVTDVIQTIAKEEKFSGSTVVKENIVHTTLTCKESSDSVVRHVLHWGFDFEHVSRDALLKLAEQTIRIRMQNQWRQDSKREDAQKYDNVTFDVNELLTVKRQNAVDPVQKAQKIIQGMSEDDKKAFLASFD